jgi:hypothetical protein
LHLFSFYRQSQSAYISFFSLLPSKSHYVLGCGDKDYRFDSTCGNFFFSPTISFTHHQFCRAISFFETVPSWPCHQDLQQKRRTRPKNKQTNNNTKSDTLQQKLYTKMFFFRSVGSHEALFVKTIVCECARVVVVLRASVWRWVHTNISNAHWLFHAGLG